MTEFQDAPPELQGKDKVFKVSARGQIRSRPRERISYNPRMRVTGWKTSTASYGARALIRGLVSIPDLEAQGIGAAEMEVTVQRRYLVDSRGDELEKEDEQEA